MRASTSQHEDVDPEYSKSIDKRIGEHILDSPGYTERIPRMAYGWQNKQEPAVRATLFVVVRRYELRNRHGWGGRDGVGTDESDETVATPPVEMTTPDAEDQ